MSHGPPPENQHKHSRASPRRHKAEQAGRKDPFVEGSFAPAMEARTGFRIGAHADPEWRQEDRWKAPLPAPPPKAPPPAAARQLRQAWAWAREEVEAESDSLFRSVVIAARAARDARNSSSGAGFPAVATAGSATASSEQRATETARSARATVLRHLADGAASAAWSPSSSFTPHDAEVWSASRSLSARAAHASATAAAAAATLELQSSAREISRDLARQAAGGLPTGALPLPTAPRRPPTAPTPSPRAAAVYNSAVVHPHPPPTAPSHRPKPPRTAPAPTPPSAAFANSPFAGLSGAAQGFVTDAQRRNVPVCLSPSSTPTTSAQIWTRPASRQPRGGSATFGGSELLRGRAHAAAVMQPLLTPVRAQQSAQAGAVPASAAAQQPLPQRLELLRDAYASAN
eukprot:scaffold8944_cov36-Phaeocystis_antarctica.AAC.1